MEDFFSLFYRNNLYGEQLYYHLRGWDDASGGFVASADKFPTIFLVTFGTALLMFLAYYYIFNHPRWNRWYHWLLPLFVSIGVGFGLAYGIVTTDLSAGVIADSLAPYIGPGNAIMFGIYNGFLGGLWFFLLSLLLRSWSKNCKHSPWPLLATKLNNKGKQDHE